MDPKVSRVPKAKEVTKENRVLITQEVIRDLRVTKESLEFKDSRVHVEIRVTKGILVLLVLREKRVSEETRDPRVTEETRDTEGTRVTNQMQEETKDM